MSSACKEKRLDALHDRRFCLMQMLAKVKKKMMAAMTKDMKERHQKKKARFNTPLPSKKGVKYPWEQALHSI